MMSAFTFAFSIQKWHSVLNNYSFSVKEEWLFNVGTNRESSCLIFIAVIFVPYNIQKLPSFHSRLSINVSLKFALFSFLCFLSFLYFVSPEILGWEVQKIIPLKFYINFFCLQENWVMCCILAYSHAKYRILWLELEFLLTYVAVRGYIRALRLKWFLFIGFLFKSLNLQQKVNTILKMQSWQNASLHIYFYNIL